MANMPLSMCTSVLGWDELYFSKLTLCALSTAWEDTISGNWFSSKGKNVDFNLELNHALVLGKLVNQSPPSLYLPEVYSFLSTPSSSAVSMTSCASWGVNSGCPWLTLMRSSGKPNSSAKSSGGTAPKLYDKNVVVVVVDDDDDE